MQAMKLSVVIVNYNVKYFLEQCLRSVSAAADGLDVEVVVVDNARAINAVCHGIRIGETDNKPCAFHLAHGVGRIRFYWNVHGTDSIVSSELVR